MIAMENKLETTDSSKKTILIVDDNASNLELLHKILAEKGYKVRAANSGAQALKSIQLQVPDLILLDIKMPGMDGYEVCRHLKESDDASSEAPVIFISAMDAVDDIISGFEAGGVDYVKKPFNPREVLARVKTQLTIKDMQRKLQMQNRELLEASRLREEVELITRHDLKGPLTAILYNPKIIMQNGPLSEKQLMFLRLIEVAGHKMLDMINRSMDLFRMERGTYVLHAIQVNIVSIIQSIFSELANEAERKELTLQLLLNGKPCGENDKFCLQGEELLCYTMLDNLIRNAVEASDKGQSVTVSLNKSDYLEIIIENDSAVPEEIRSTFFDKLSTSGKKGGTGLGTYSARLSAETQGGTIELDTSDEEGTQITIRFPFSEAPKD